MNKVYAVMSKLMSVFPDKWNNKDTQGAVLGFIVVSVLGASGWKFGPDVLQFVLRLFS
jgi:hypothetical protein